MENRLESRLSGEQESQAYLVSRSTLKELFNKLVSMGYHVIAPVRKRGVTVFKYVENFNSINTSYVRTILPLKKYLLPPEETILHFIYENGEVRVEENMEHEKYAFFLIHPCDANALKILDLVLLNGHYVDTKYLNRRRNSMVVVLECERGDEYCFCESLGTDKPWNGTFDISLSPLNGEFQAIPGSQKGLKLLEEMNLQKVRKKNIKRIRNVKRIEKLRIERIRERMSSSLWAKYASKCVSCGVCTLVCPTCICFEIEDRFEKPMKEGFRYRYWSSCLYSEFTKIAGGIIFRKNKIDRFTHRFYHKFVFMKDRYGIYGCVGCGRCIAECHGKIDVVEVINDIAR